MRELAVGATLLVVAGAFLVAGSKKITARAELKLEPVTQAVQDDTPQPRKPKKRRIGIVSTDVVLSRDFDFWEPLIIACESGGNPTAENPDSSASGLYQITFGSWAFHGGYREAKDAPPEIQREKARLLFDSSGLRPWFADSRAKKCILGRAS